MLGSQTTARGVLGVYDTVQWTNLNKRLVYVLLEGIIESLFANQRQIPPLLRLVSYIWSQGQILKPEYRSIVDNKTRFMIISVSVKQQLSVYSMFCFYF